MSYVSLPVQINAEALVQECFSVMEEAFPGWQPKPGNPEVIAIRAAVYVLAVPLAQLASDVADEIFARFGEEIVKVQPHEETPASGKVKFTAVDNAGYPIPVGTQVDVEVPGAQPETFRTSAPASIAPGSTSVTGVPIEAVNDGTAANNLSGAASLVDALNYITAVAVEGETGGGADAEESSAYLSRLVEVMQTLAPRPIIGRDVATIARTVAGVQRVAVIDNYNTSTGESSLEKTTSLAPLGPDGADVSTPTLEAVKALLASRREANYVFVVVKPSRTPIYVKAVLVATPGFSQAQAVASAEAGLRNLLDDGLWGTGEQLDRTHWENTKVLRYQDVVTVINNAQAVDHYTTLEIKKEGGSYGTADVTLNGDFPLPEVKTLTIS